MYPEAFLEQMHSPRRREREEQLVSEAEGAARDETDRIDSSVSSRIWCRDASGGCDFRADVSVWDDIGSLHSCMGA